MIDLLIYYVPPLTRPLVLIADKEKVVISMMISDINIIAIESKMPACPTIHGSRRKSITPHILSKHGFSTPSIHPNFILSLTFNLLFSS